MGRTSSHGAMCKGAVVPSDIKEAANGETVETFGREIVVGIKGYDESLAAKEWALEHVCRPGDTVCLLHVMEEDGTAVPGCLPCTRRSSPGPRPSCCKESRAEVEEMLQRMARGAYMKYMVHAVPVIRVGQVGPTIVAEARGRNAAAVVLGSSRAEPDGSRSNSSLSAINKFCQRRAPCPVIAVEQRHQRCGTRRAAMDKVTAARSSLRTRGALREGFMPRSESCKAFSPSAKAQQKSLQQMVPVQC